MSETKSQLGSDFIKAAFPLVPASWFYLCPSSELDRPFSLMLCGHEFVGYRAQSGRVVVMSGRCSHLGARLCNGAVKGERIICPLHGWEFGPEGVCESIPGNEPIPGFARQASYPVGEIGGQVFFFNRKQARFELPFFEGLQPESLLPAKPFELIAEAPWYFVGANGFDIQHFKMAHDRTLVGEPVVSSPAPYARRIIATFTVTGNTIQDRLTRSVAGPQVTMEVTVWCGSLIIVKAKFARTTSYGIFNVLPIDANRTLGRVIVWVKRSDNLLSRAVLDPVNAAIRRIFIQAFLRSDLPRIAGLRYQASHLTAADGVMAGYFNWLESVCEISTSDIS